MSRQAEYRARLVKKERCINHPDEPPRKGLKTCALCLEKGRRNRQSLVADGRCWRCKMPTSGTNGKCRACLDRQVWSDLKKNYGLSEEQYRKRFDAQGGKCAICARPRQRVTEAPGKAQALQVDHCHKTGRVRGLLCFGCNVALGHVRESPTILIAMVVYLRRAGC